MNSTAPTLRCYFNLLGLEGLPQSSAGLESIAEAGYDGVQFIAPASTEELRLCDRLRLARAGSGRINKPEEADPFAARMAAEGQGCATIHLGWGMEDDDEGARLIDALLAASSKHSVPIYPETHRATLFQDMWRTVQFVRRFPTLRFNGDFSHWYTGLEMVYGGFEEKLRFIDPVLQRVRFLHGRIGNPGCIQVKINSGDLELQPYVAHFRALWIAALRGFLASAAPGDFICFTPELLSSRIYYARTFNGVEESDRWQQSLALREIARECFEAAR